mmetsp:Transcript_53785/g.48386  ORF Transcript_53785/g.48386 Transcript_53785/m.48386 type:complete len:280 (-) Transcript_53785:17-856(-)
MAHAETFEVELMSGDTIQNIKMIIQIMKGYHCNNQTLKFSGIILRDDKKLYECGLTMNTTLQLEVNVEQNEMGLAAGGKMKQKIYPDDEINIGQYNVKKVTRVFVNIANGNMWKAITGRKLPESPLNPQIYKSYGYPWFDLYDDNMEDVEESKILKNIMSINDIDDTQEIDDSDNWQCPLCTFSNVRKNTTCCMCGQGKPPSMEIDQSDIIGIEHPDNPNDEDKDKNKNKKEDKDADKDQNEDDDGDKDMNDKGKNKDEDQDKDEDGNGDKAKIDDGDL